MLKERASLIGLIILQIVALVIYPPAFFQPGRAPEAAVLPPALLLLYALALIGMNTRGLSPNAGRTSLTFVQGVNIVVRLLLLFPNLKTPTGSWDIALLLTQLVGIALSWYTIAQLEKRPLHSLLLRPQN